MLLRLGGKCDGFDLLQQTEKSRQVLAGQAANLIHYVVGMMPRRERMEAPQSPSRSRERSASLVIAIFDHRSSPGPVAQRVNLCQIAVSDHLS